MKTEFYKEAPKMPRFGKGTECLKLMLSQVSKDMREPLVPMIFPILGAHIKETQFQYPDRSWKEPCGMMATLIADSGAGKGQLSNLVDALCSDFRQHDREEMQKLVEWQKQVKTKSANKEKPARPDIALYMPPADVTNAAFIQNAMNLEKMGCRTQYINMPEIEMADRLCGGHRQVSQMIRNIFDRQRAGALRATADGLSGDATIRVNLTLSATPYAARQFFKYELFNGTFGRMVISYKPCTEPTGIIPIQGEAGEKFLNELGRYVDKLTATKGRFVVSKLNKVITKLAEEMAQMAVLTDDRTLWDMSKRSLVSAWKAGCIMWILNNQEWTKPMADIVQWLVYHDLYSKIQVFADKLAKKDSDAEDNAKQGPKNMLDSLPNDFSLTQLEALRVQLDKPKEGAYLQAKQWVHRKFVTYSSQTGLYTKTEKYLNR